MDKTQVIKQLHQARPQHVFWVKEGRKLLNGLPQDKIQKPQSGELSHFSRWYEAEGHKLVNIPELKKAQELSHDIHTAFTALYFTTFDRRKKARATIISGDMEIPIDEMPFRRKKLNVLEAKTVKFIKALMVIERKVESMKEEDFENGWLV